MKIPRGAHVLVMDGGKLLLFKNDAGEAEPVLTVVLHREHEGLATREQGSDRPGTTHESASPRRSSYEQTDLRQLDEDRFAGDAADLLEQEVLAGRIDALIIVAAPRTLGELRKKLHGEVEKRVIASISKDLVGRTTEDILAAIVRH